MKWERRATLAGAGAALGSCKGIVGGGIMASDAWVFQRAEQVRDMGADEAPWYVGWYDRDGHRHKESCGAGFHGQKKAERRKRQIENALLAGNEEKNSRKLWPEFRREYDERVLAGLAVATRLQAAISLDHFERLVKPIRVFGLATEHIDEFIARRRQERGRKKGEPVSPATVNKDLRHIKAALTVAHEWRYLYAVPKFRMEKAPRKLPTYVTGEHFALIYGMGCEAARKPGRLPYSPADWWRGLLAMAYMTGWRIGDILALRRDQLDLDAGTAVSLAEDNKGKRDELVKLHPAVIEHLRPLSGFTPTVFPWCHNRRTLDEEFLRIQEAAGVKLPCPERHEHTRHCHAYSFHDLRRAFATMNADKLSPDALQALMRHKSYTTTQVYINLTRQMDQAVASLHVPEVFKTVPG
jgi:integrase